jgi:hypothetical protein
MANVISESIVWQPEYFRLPKPGAVDQFFQFNRAFYYAAEARGWLKLIRVRAPGKSRGITLVPYKSVLALVRAQAEKQS